MRVLGEPGVNLGLEEAEALSSFAIRDQVLANPAVNGGFGRMFGQVADQLVQVEPLVFYNLRSLCLLGEDNFLEFIDFLDEGGYR